MTHELKSLQGRRDKMRQVISICESEVRDKHKELSQKNKELNDKRKQLNLILKNIKDIEDRRKDVVISEHAILRYLERVKGFNLEDIKNEMLDVTTKDTLKVLPVNKIKCAGYNLIVKNNVITTVTL